MSEDRHQQRQQRLKEQVDARVAAAQDERGILIVFTGNHRRIWDRHPRSRARSESGRDPVYQG